MPLYKSLILFILLLVSSSSILAFTYSFFLSLKCLLATRPTLFRLAALFWFGSCNPGVGNLLVVLCRSNVAKSLSVPTHPSPPYFYIQQPLKHVNLILSKLSFRRDVTTRIALKELYASIYLKIQFSMRS